MEKFDINALDIKTLRLLLAIAKTGSVSAAALQRGMTQSTASYGLEKLRTAFQDPIFVRTGKGVAPTARGDQIVAACGAILQQMDDLAAGNRFEPASARRDFTLAASAYEIGTVLARLRPRLAEQAPGCRLILRPIELDRIAQLLDGDCDIALMSEPRDTASLKRTLLFEDDYVTFYDNRVRTAPDGLDAFCAAPQAVVTLGGSTTTDLDRELAKLGRSRTVSLVVNTFESLGPMMRNSDLVATLPRRIGDGPMAGFDWTPCPVALAPLPIYAVWHLRKDSAAGHRWLRQQIRHAARAATPEASPS